MASHPISSGSPASPLRADAPPSPARALLLAALAAALSPLHAAEPKALGAEPRLLPAERAFALSIQAIDDRTVEARFVIADGYYLYRDKLSFAVAPTGLASAPVLPPGAVKDDPFFGNVETYRGRLAIRLPLEPGAEPGRKVTVRAESQGCADAGVCYPPQVQHVTVALPAPGARPGPPVAATPARKSWFN